MSQTLDNMTIAQLREIAERAERRAQEIEREQAEAKRRVQDAKDIVPDVGTEWDYNGRYWVTAAEDRGERLLLSIPKGGGTIRGWWYKSRFSETAKHPTATGWIVGDVYASDYDPQIVRLALRVRD